MPANHICMDYEGVEVKYTAGQPYVGAIVRMFPGPGGHRGRFISWDPMKGKVNWEIKENLAAYGGALTTASGLVFYGTMEGWLKAVDQKSGKVLWQFKTPSGIIGNPMTYMRLTASSTWQCTRASVAGPASAWPPASAPRIRPQVWARSARSATRASSAPRAVS